METSMFALPPVFSFVSSCPFPLLVHAHPCWVFWLVILYAYLGFFLLEHRSHKISGFNILDRQRDRILMCGVLCWDYQSAQYHPNSSMPDLLSSCVGSSDKRNLWQNLRKSVCVPCLTSTSCASWWNSINRVRQYQLWSRACIITVQVWSAIKAIMLLIVYPFC